MTHIFVGYDQIINAKWSMLSDSRSDDEDKYFFTSFFCAKI